MTIEHYCSQGHFPNQQLDWQNMLAVCHGQHPLATHCDHHRSQEQQHPLPRGELRIFDPRAGARYAEELITYDAQGALQINPTSPVAQGAADDVVHDLFTLLNLNCEPLAARRRAILDEIRRQVMRLEGERRHLSATHHQQLIAWWSEVNDGRHRPYFMVALDWLRKHPPRR